MTTQIRALPLRAIERSPTNAQYYTPKYKSPHQRPAYVKKFHPNDEIKHTLAQPWLAHTDPMMPIYPYGGNHHFTEANHGLYGGLTIRSGNKISKGRNKGKTLRKWYPNIRPEKLVSKSLGVEMTLPVAARVSRTIRKCGGLDEYLLGPKPARVKELGLLGWKLRWLVLNSEGVKEAYEKERETLGLSERGRVDLTFAEAWEDEGTREKILKRLGKTVGRGKVKKTGLSTKKVVEMERSRIASVPRVEKGFGLLDMPKQVMGMTLGQSSEAVVRKKVEDYTGDAAPAGEGFKSLDQLEELERNNDKVSEKDFLQGHIPMAGEMGRDVEPDLPLSSSVTSPLQRQPREREEEDEEERRV